MGSVLLTTSAGQDCPDQVQKSEKTQEIPRQAFSTGYFLQSLQAL